MNENLNLVEILKYCPKGTKLYSTAYGEVKLYKVVDNKYPICIENNFGDHYWLTQDGRLFSAFDGECILFPSKEQRDWSKFKPNKESFVPHCKFKDGDIIATRLGSQVFILKREESDGRGYCYVGYDFKNNIFFDEGKWSFSRLATEEEKQKLFDTIKLNGYKWNAETKTLEKLVKPKFKVGNKIINIPRKYMGASGTQGIISKITDDKYIFSDGSYMSISSQDSWELAPNRFNPKTLKPFDRVLVRDGCKFEWQCNLFSHIDNDSIQFMYQCMNSGYKYCIPYNEDTKHLVGTTEEAPDYYRY